MHTIQIKIMLLLTIILLAIIIIVITTVIIMIIIITIMIIIIIDFTKVHAHQTFFFSRKKKLFKSLHNLTSKLGTSALPISLWKIKLRFLL